MAQIKVDLDRETTVRLAQCAAEERRPMPWQAEVMIRRALGLVAPVDITVSDSTRERSAADEPA